MVLFLKAFSLYSETVKLLHSTVCETVKLREIRRF